MVLVTGGSAGLGFALVDRLLDEGARVAFCGRDPRRLAAAQTKLARHGGACLAVRADVRSVDQLEGFVRAAEETFGGVDALVNNAGSAAGGEFEANDDAYWQADLDAKLMSAVRASRLVIPRLRSRGGGSILNVLSVWARTPGAGSTPSSVSRAAGLALTKALSHECGRDGIRVNAVLIGILRSTQWEAAAERQGVSPEQFYCDVAAEYAIPLGAVGAAEDFADLGAFLLSRRATYVSGAAINLDGGLSLA
ncbi:SDR family oxidoreductase [Pseudonocardia halophobica]